MNVKGQREASSRTEWGNSEEEELGLLTIAEYCEAKEKRESYYVNGARRPGETPSEIALVEEEPEGQVRALS